MPREQTVHLNRVSSNIGPTIVEFVAARIGDTFYMADLLQYVRARFPDTAPDSPSRILRMLRQNDSVEYEVVNRRQSLYRVLAA